MVVRRDEAVVLRTHDLGEADRIITLLTRRGGRVRAVAKGVRRTRSRFGGRLEPGAHVDLQLWTGRSLDIVREAVGIAEYGDRVLRDYAAHTCAQAVLETAERLTAEEGEPAPRLFALVLGALNALSNGEHPSGLVLDAFLLRAMAGAGYGFALLSCARCEAPGPHRAFSVALGGGVCPEHRPPGCASPDAAALVLMAALLEGDWAATRTGAVTEDRIRQQASTLVASLVQWHLDARLRALPLVERGA